MDEFLKSSHNLLDLIPTTFLLTDFHSKILYANRQVESFFGYEREELEGQRIRILFLDEDLIYFLPNIIFLTRYKNGFNGEALLKQKDGKRIFAHLFTTSFKEGGELFLTFAFQEIQRLKSLERERLEVERWASLGKMVEEIAHQFRNPIVSIGGYTNRLRKGVPSSPRSRFYLDQIQEKVGRLEESLQRLEEYIQIPRPVFQQEKIEEVVETVLTGLSKQPLAKGVSIRLERGDLAGDGQLFMDRGLMIKVLRQILENSLEAVHLKPMGKQKGVVQVSLFDDGEMVKLVIADRGQGISKKNVGMIFEPFFSTRPDRVGLGLTFVRRVVEEHGGRIQVDSRLNRGTTMTLYLPKDRRRKVRREWISPEASKKEDC